MLTLVTLTMTSCSQSTNTDEDSIDRLMEKDKDDYIKRSFKEFLTGEKISLDSKLENEFEIIQPGNLYSNFYYNLTFDLPDDWMVDRGVSEYTILRGIVLDSAMAISLNVSPLIDKKNPLNSKNINTIEHQNEIYNGDYRKSILHTLKSQGGVDAKDLTVNELKIGTNDFIETSYLVEETFENKTYYSKISTFQTNKFNTIYTINYSAPEVFYERQTIENVLLTFKALNPKMGGRK